MKLIVLLLLISHCIQAEPVRSSSYGIMLASQYQITAPWLKIADATLQADKTLSLDAISNLLHTQYPELSDKLRTYILTSIKCVEHNNIAHNNILSIIDYSLPSNRRRLWIFDLGAQKLLFHTYVSHGLKSGILSPE